MNLKKVDILFIILIVILTIFSIDLLFNETHQETVENVSKYPQFQDLGTGLLITFWVCVIGNLIPFPTPYAWVVCFSSQPFFDNLFIPFLVAFVASLGCLIGEMGGYAIGRGTAKIASEERLNRLNKINQFIIKHPKILPFLIFIAALTPLNDDMITIPAGLLKYSFKKTIFFCWLGKLGLMLIFAYNLVNICSLIGGESWILSIISLYIIVIMIYFFIRVDFLKIIRKVKTKKKSIN